MQYYLWVWWLSFLTGAASALAVLWLVLRHVVAKPVQVCDSCSLEWYLDEDAHTGDIIYFREPRDFLHSLVSPMSHIGVIVMHPITGTPLVVEMLEAGTEVASEPQSAGVHVFPARTRLESFDGGLYVSRIRSPLNASRVLGIVDSLRSTPYLHGPRMHIAKCKFLPWYSGMDNRAMICSEFVGRVLSEAGVLAAPWKCTTPSDIMHAASHCPAYHCATALTP